MFYLTTDTSITVYFNDGPITVTDDHIKWKDIKLAVSAGAVTESLKNLMSIKHAVQEAVKDSTNFSVTNYGVLFNGKYINNTLTQRIMDMFEKGLDYSPLQNFLIKCQNNTSFRVVNSLYDFLDKGQLPITPEGNFLAYKVVTSNYKDKYTRTLNNNVGCKVSVPRNEVDENPDQTCSNGLHVCSYSYVQHFLNRGDRLVCVEVDPVDVVAIPRDYNDSKMRTCGYTVISDITDLKDVLDHKLVIDTKTTTVLPNRDKLGRFVANS